MTFELKDDKLIVTNKDKEMELTMVEAIRLRNMLNHFINGELEEEEEERE